MREIYNMTDSPPSEYFVFNSPDSPDTLIPDTNSNSDSSQTVTPTNQMTPTSDFTLSVFGQAQTVTMTTTVTAATTPSMVASQCLPKALTMSQANELLKCFQTSCATSSNDNNHSTRLSLTNLLPSRSATIIIVLM